MEKRCQNHYIVTMNSGIVRDAQLYTGSSKEPWNDDDNWADMDNVTPYLGVVRLDDEAAKEAARKKYADEYGCKAEDICLQPLEIEPDAKITPLISAGSVDKTVIANTLVSEVVQNDRPAEKIGQNILEALACNDADMLVAALTGWSAKDILVKAGAFPDEENVFSEEESEKVRFIRVRQVRVRQEGFSVETYETEIYMSVPVSITDIQVTESYLLDRFKAPLKEFMGTVAGQKAWNATCHDFNWGDWCTEIPTALLNKHGLYWTVDEIRQAGLGGSFRVTDTRVWNVHQDEVIGYGPEDWEMSDEERKNFYKELADNYIDMAADEIEGHPGKYLDISADEVDLTALRRKENKDFRALVADALSDDGYGIEILSSNDTEECVNCVWNTYKQWRSGEPE